MALLVLFGVYITAQMSTGSVRPSLHSIVSPDDGLDVLISKVVMHDVL